MIINDSPTPKGIFRRQNSIPKDNKPETFRRKRTELRRARRLQKESKKKKTSSETSTKNAVLNQISHGTISVIGRRREMEDAVSLRLNFLHRNEKWYDFYGVYDGHGGWRVADACAESMHKLVKDILEDDDVEELVEWDKVMVEAFRRMDEEVNKKGAAIATTGSTAVVAVVGDEEIVVANCGDSRAVISQGGVAVQVLDDHKPDRPDELERIEDCGGKVINWNGQRVLGVLATSRSIGDQYLKPFVVPEPEVKVINRTCTDEFLVLASDGLWDVISNDLACHVVRRCLDGRLRCSQLPMVQDAINNCENNEEIGDGGRAVEAAAVLAELAIARGSRDNISVTVVQLNPTG